jgi:hypothetical protein
VPSGGLGQSAGNPGGVRAVAELLNRRINPKEMQASISSSEIRKIKYLMFVFETCCCSIASERDPGRSTAAATMAARLSTESL